MSQTVIPRTVLVSLVYGLPLLVVAFGVLMGAYGLAQATEDLPAARVLRGVAASCLLLIVTDIILLVGALGVNALSKAEERSDDVRQ